MARTPQHRAGGDEAIRGGRSRPSLQGSHGVRFLGRCLYRLLGCNVTRARHRIALEGMDKGHLMIDQSPGGTRGGVSAEHHTPGEGWADWETWGGEEGERCAVLKPGLGLFLLEEGRCITAFSSLKSCKKGNKLFSLSGEGQVAK